MTALETKLAEALRLQMLWHDQGHSPCACADSRDVLAAYDAQAKAESECGCVDALLALCSDCLRKK